MEIHENNPLIIITDWLHEQPIAFQVELLLIAGHFHPDKDLWKSSPSKKQYELFLEYMNYHLSDKREIVVRTFITMRLIDYAFSGRNSDEGWQETFDNNLMAAEKFKRNGQSTKVFDNFFATYEERKEEWIGRYNSWEQMKITYLDDRQTAQWYFSSLKP